MLDRVANAVAGKLPPDGLAASLSVREVTVTYPNGTAALRDTTFELGPGTICGLVGINGSGKSTLFKTVMGLMRPQRGEVQISGLPVDVALRRNLVAYVPQSEEVDWNFPVLVEDVVMMGRYGHMGFLRIPSADDKRKVAEALERVGMTAFRHRQIGELSGGQKKRVFLARALAQRPEVILADEPTASLDPALTSSIMDTLKAINQRGLTLVVSQHQLETALAYATRIVGFRHGRIAFDGPPSAVTPTIVRTIYGERDK